jgi:peroxiredoxin
MDNVNVIRVGFFAPRFKISDTDSETDDPIDRSGAKYTCLLFVNPDKPGASIIMDLEKDLPRTQDDLETVLSAIVPVKLKPAKEFKEKYRFRTRLFCDSDLRAGKLFSVIDSSTAGPAYHPTAFVIGDEGSIRYRQIAKADSFDTNLLRTSIRTLT